MSGRIILGIANPSLDADGAVAAASTLTFYENGTTTLQSIYADAALNTPLSNPLSCDAAGRFPIIWADLANTYSVKWTPGSGSPITYDDIVAMAGVSGGRGGATSATIRTTTISSSISVNDGTVIVNAAGATTQTLPSAALSSGLIFTVKNINSGLVTVAGTIDGGTNFLIQFKNQSASFQSNGTSFIST